MKTKTLLLLGVLFFIVFLMGCGNKVKNEAELRGDLIGSSNFEMIEGSEVTNLSIIKRLIDEDNKKDTVYVSVELEHKAAKESRAYIMYYTKYEDGWRLDSVETYYGDEISWTIQPKNIPSNKQIMQELIEWSNANIDAAYDVLSEDLSEELTNTYFFEEGKYATQIFSGERISECIYSCIVETERVFNVVDVKELRVLFFEFDSLTYQWAIYDSKLLDLRGEWYLEGIWEFPTNGANIQYDQYEGSYGIDAYEKYKGVCSHNEDIWDFNFTLVFPTSEEIPWFMHSIGGDFDSVDLRIKISPDRIFGKEGYWGSQYMDLELVSSEREHKVLETTGIIDMSSKDNTKPYNEIAKEAIDYIFVEKSISSIEKLWHPVVVDDELKWIEEFIEDNEYKLISTIPLYSTVITNEDSSNQENFLALQQVGIEAEDICICTFYLEVEYDGEIQYKEFQVNLVEEEGKIYILNAM